MSTPSKPSGLLLALRAANSTSSSSSRQSSRTGSKQNLILGAHDAYFEFLPAELLENIFSYCPTMTLWVLTLVNRGCLHHARSQLKIRQPISDYVIGVLGGQYSWMSIFVPPSSPIPKTLFPMPRDPAQPEGDELYDYEPCFEVSLKIRNDAYHKVVGIVWTEDQWRTTRKAFAHYDSQIDSFNEKWVLTAGPIARYQTPVEFRAFVTMNGRTTWTSCPNHMVCEIVSNTKPVVRQNSRVISDPTYGLCVEGKIRLWDVFPRGKLLVRYTIDEWQTYHDELAYNVNGREWRFKICGLDRRRIPRKPSSSIVSPRTTDLANGGGGGSPISHHVNTNSAPTTSSVSSATSSSSSSTTASHTKSVTVVVPASHGLSNSLERSSALLNHHNHHQTQSNGNGNASAVPKRIMFAVKYQRGSATHWDNNNNWNYCHQFVPSMRVELLNQHNRRDRLAQTLVSPPSSPSPSEERDATESESSNGLGALGVLTFEFECITDLPIEKMFFDLKGGRQRSELLSMMREKKYPNSEQKGYFLTHTISSSKIRSGRQKATFTVVCNKSEYSKSIEFHVASSIGDFLSLETQAECAAPSS